MRPSRIIVTVEIVLRTSFCAVPAFSRVEPAITSGPTTTATSCSARAAASAVASARDGDAERTRFARRLQRSEHERRRAARADGDDAVLGPEGEPAQCVRRRSTIVLVRILLGDDGENLTRWRAEGGAALGGVERGECSRRAGAGVDQPAAAAHALDDCVDRGG